MNLFDYALCGRWDERLDQLAEIAEPERWRYRKLPSDFEGRWWLHSWQVESSHHLARFDALPGVARYWSDPATIVYDPSKRVIPNVDHIIAENWERFPEEFGGTVGSDGTPRSLSAAPDEEEVMSQRPSAEEEAEGAELAGGEVPERTRFVLRNVLDGAISRSVRLAERSYRVAVPQRYHGRIQLLLPLYLREAREVDLALTLEFHGDRYRAATVLFPDWAYTHARLLSRPNSEWLGGFPGES